MMQKSTKSPQMTWDEDVDLNEDDEFSDDDAEIIEE